VMSALGSLPDIDQQIRGVRFTPKSGHVQRRNRCLLCAISGHWIVVMAISDCSLQLKNVLALIPVE
jgi:hypothetical protein